MRLRSRPAPITNGSARPVRISRREFLRKAAGASLAISAGPLASLGHIITKTNSSYDAIIVGGGTAGAIVATRLRSAGRGRKRILIIEAGGATAAAIGGRDFAPFLSPNRSDLTIFDVPGLYSQMAFMPLGAPFQLKETSFTYQGIGLGGNSAFNGMLFQTNPPELFDANWPANWKWARMKRHFAHIRKRIPVTNTPSTDGVAHNTGPAMIVHPLYADNGWREADTSGPFIAPGFYSRPYVAAANGRRANSISGYFEEIDRFGVPVGAIDILPYTKADRIVFDDSGRARAIQYTTRPGLDQSLPGVPGIAKLKAGGIVIMAAGALITPRLLLLSGVGPRGRESEFFPNQSPAPFAIDNQLIGVNLFDHVATLVSYTYSGQIPYQAYNYGDFAANSSDIGKYLKDGSGPYAQYRPVSILNYASRGTIPDVEIFLDPNGAGPVSGKYYAPDSFSAFAMLLNPKSRGLVTLGPGGEVNFPNIYLPDSPDGAADTAAMAQAVFDMIQLFKKDPGLRIFFGPGGMSHPNLNPDSLDDVRTYVTGPSPVDDVFFNRLIINHYGGTAQLSDGPGGVDPHSLIVRGTKNVAVVDASLIPTVVPGHPVGTIMAVADRAGAILGARWQ